MQETLFDETFIGTLPSLDIRYDNSHVVALCRGREDGIVRSRQQLTEWYRRVEPSKRQRLLNRLRSLDDAQHLAAYFELYFHDLLTSLNFGFTYDPNIHRQCPDFSFTRNGSKAILEVLTLVDTDTERETKYAIDLLKRQIDRRCPGWSYSFHLESPISRKARINLAVDRIADAIAENQQAEDSIEIRLDEFGIHATVELTTQYGFEGWMSTVGPMGSSDPFTDKVREALQQKIKRYKVVKAERTAFIVAICTDHLWVNVRSIMDALYGREQIRFSIQEPKVTWAGRDNSGLVAPGSVFVEPRNTRLSGVILCKRQYSDENGYSFENNVFHNPNAAVLLGLDVFDVFPQFAEISRDERVRTFDWIGK